MKIFKTLSEYIPDKLCVVSVGNFDGVHSGHALLVREVIKRARRNHKRSVIVTFEPHTRLVLSKGLRRHAPPILSTFQEKCLLLENLGVEAVVCVPFNHAFRNLSAEKFVQSVLLSKLNATDWVMGKEHRFGKNRLGTINSLHEIVSRNDITICPIDLTARYNKVVSSTEIRTLLTRGDVEKAVELLGHPYLIIARRTSGKKIGSSLGFPTLNFKKAAPEKVLPPAGVYAAQLHYGSKRFRGALYFGSCPTFEKRDVHFEFHCLADPKKTVPGIGENANIWVYKFIRPDKTFDGPDELKSRITQDVKQIKHYFS